MKSKSVGAFLLVCVMGAGLAAKGQNPDSTCCSSTSLSMEATSKEPGLLFYLSGDHGFNADYAAGGNAAPNFNSDIKILPGGAKGSYLQCGNNQLLSYWAPGNIYSQRGTLSFYWRPHDPVDETAFPIFRVGYADHSSWDQVWLRIDYNGHGFDAFVTDVNLGRTRISYDLPSFPKPDQWVNLTLTWDETTGIRFYVNGKMVAEKAATGMFDAGLDQFGPHSRIIGPTGVESSYSYDRGGDLDELRIYDRALSDDNVASLAKGETPRNIPAVTRSLANEETRKEWWFHYGWNRPGELPAPLPATNTTVRKVQINDAYDIGRWWWRANDGIRETTWPGVYNRSRLTGRFDYFQLPDWDCYAISGKTVTFILPDEPWNHLEFNGGAFGNMTLLTPDVSEEAVRRAGLDGKMLPGKTLFERPSGQETTFHDISEPVTGGKLRFTNVEQETPIGEFSAYYVHAGDPPEGTVQLKYRLTTHNSPADNPTLLPLVNFIHDRYPADERAVISGVPGGYSGAPGGFAGGRGRFGTRRVAMSQESEPSLPIVHILIPADLRGLPADTTHIPSYTWDDMYAGLDGIAIDLPALKVKPTHGDYVPMNIEVRDPLWPMRDMLNFTFSVKPGEAHTLWLDTRDRILPNDKSLLITIASASAEFNVAALEGVEVRLIFKPYKDALKEHVADRLTQVRDNFSNMTEEHVNSRRLNTYNRFYADISDLLRVDPTNDLGRKYWHEWNPETAPPDYTPPTVPADVPSWAYLQAKDVDYFQRIADFYVDKRQAWDGEFGGGLGDDSDFTNLFPSLALMGTEPDKLKKSLSRELEAMYENKMWTNGLATGQFDELHSYEDGLNVLGQSLMMDFGNPKDLERAMATARRLEWLTGVNAAGHRHIRSSYFSGTKMAEGGVWGWTKGRSYMVFHPALNLVLFNGAPETRKMVLETVDGMLAHRKQEADGRFVTRTEINFKTDEDLPWGDSTPDFMFWAAYRWTGDQKYLLPFMDAGPWALAQISSDALDMLKLRETWGKQVVAVAGPTDATSGVAQTRAQSTSGSAETFAWQVTGDTKYLDRLYTAQLQAESNREWINTEGSLWIDRVTDSAGPMFVNTELQRARFGGIALVRNHIYPGNSVGWKFVAPATPSSVGILVPEATPDHLKIIVYNLETVPVKAQMIGWEIDPGKWEITQGTRGDVETDPVVNISTRSENFERSTSLDFTFAPHTTTVLELKLVEKGVPYWSRPDLGIGADDVTVEGSQMKVTVHSLGSVDAPASKVVLRDNSGRVLATASAAPLKAPVDLLPKTEVVSLTLPSGADWKGGSVSVEITGTLPEITLMNNRVQF
ncbi:MAG: LamG-like jellyroll fold domain-containing protein [Terracidiphilus sp.]